MGPDSKGEHVQAWNVFAAPSNFLIDGKGKIRYTLFGGVDWDSDDIVNTIKQLAADTAADLKQAADGDANAKGAMEVKADKTDKTEKADKDGNAEKTSGAATQDAEKDSTEK